MRRFAFLLAAALAAAPAAAADPAPAMTEAEAASVQLALDRGTLIYAYDQAAWHGTDDALAKLGEDSDRLGGWIVDGPADAPELVFHDHDQAEPKAVYVARFKAGKLVESRILRESDDRTLSPERKAMIAARRAAAEALPASGATRCKEQPFNSVVLPASAPGKPVLVYFLTPQTSMDAIPMGGHYRAEVGSDGKAGKVRPFTKACMELPLTEKKKKGKPAALVLGHLLDPTPTEMHVFSAGAIRMPIYVMTSENGRVWEVTATTIRLVDDKAQASTQRTR
jgi:hypothetical protein